MILALEKCLQKFHYARFLHLLLIVLIVIMFYALCQQICTKHAVECKVHFTNVVSDVNPSRTALCPKL